LSLLKWPSGPSSSSKYEALRQPQPVRVVTLAIVSLKVLSLGKKSAALFQPEASILRANSIAHASLKPIAGSSKREYRGLSLEHHRTITFLVFLSGENVFKFTGITSRDGSRRPGNVDAVGGS